MVETPFLNLLAWLRSAPSSEFIEVDDRPGLGCGIVGELAGDFAGVFAEAVGGLECLLVLVHGGR